jgi:hypothetical protein
MGVSTVTRLIVALGILLSLAGAANALGRLFLARAPTGGCTSTGIYDLSNTCNDIYFIGALK